MCKSAASGGLGVYLFLFFWFEWCFICSIDKVNRAFWGNGFGGFFFFRGGGVGGGYLASKASGLWMSILSV